ncbi:hypothetical protein MWU75_10330 [Ornithinimicrobium sp. F0845]|uniref:hypothetical protein n=1 Tax=Ornithinimicrobium sp. F0845 TaxID=2926412 RepID=UPI001FF5FB70|nr:hypothetical protein [Ornithinimicrobium sp. F0845]MCK0112535.1 hypothetical protein [Ornithinimicrobium sp. F0845]
MPRPRTWPTALTALATVLFTPVLVLLTPTAALACSCGPADTEQLLGYVDTVAVGELTAVEPPPARGDGSVSSDDRVTYTAELETVFKGEPEDPLTFRSVSHGASCGLEDMQVGHDYVFFVRDGESGLCDGTSRATPGLIAEVEAVTGPGQPVAAPDPATASDPVAAPDPATASDPVAVVEPAPEADPESAAARSVWPALGPAAGALVLLAAGWLLWRRSSHG